VITGKQLIVIGGPTASGKTSLAIAIARHFGTEIISGDSRQFYQELRIGSARPDDGELAAATHHFIADRSVTDPLTAGRFAEEAVAKLETIFAHHDHAILVGGSGLYLRALCEGLDAFPEVTDAARTQVQRVGEEQGLPGLQTELERLDPAYFATVDRHNPRRLERALSVCYTAGQPYSSFLGNRPERPFQCVYFQPVMDRPTLYARINRRVDQMLAAGLEAEARALSAHGDLPALQTVGYREWWPYFDGEYDYDRAVTLIKQNSRRYAKRQTSWFGRGGVYLPVTGLAEAVAKA
jgi:tRNA dimethylallyltransferase